MSACFWPGPVVTIPLDPPLTVQAQVGSTGERSIGIVGYLASGFIDCPQCGGRAHVRGAYDADRRRVGHAEARCVGRRGLACAPGCGWFRWQAPPARQPAD